MWYSASILLKSVHSTEAPGARLWEEVIVVVDAMSPDKARRAAEIIGASKEHDYRVAQPQVHTVRWTFVAVERICEIQGNPVASGTEVFSRFLRASEARSLLTPFD